MTHEYTLLVGGRVMPGGDARPATAIAWAGDTVLALGSDEEVRAISRGDSHFVDLRGATVIPMPPNVDATSPTSATLEVGGRADLVILRDDQPIAVVRGGILVSGSLPGG